jgi:hypothetical protein
MPCVLTIIALAFPRIVLFLVFLLSNYLGRAYQTVLWPFLGFFLMPLTTLAYAWAINSAGSVQGIYLVAVVIAVLIDLGLIGSGEHSRRRRAG